MKLELPEKGFRALDLAAAAFTASRHPDVELTTKEGWSLSGIPRKEKDYTRGIVYLKEMAARRGTKNQAFLGGACGPTTWRRDVVIPALKKKGLAFWNPQVDDWEMEDRRLRLEGIAGGMAEAESRAKAESSVLLFVLSKETRGIATLVEAAELLGSPFQKIILCVEFLPFGTVIDGETLSDAEVEDINAARSWLADQARVFRWCGIGTVVSTDKLVSMTEALETAASLVVGALEENI